jgi:mannosyltransferase
LRNCTASASRTAARGGIVLTSLSRTRAVQLRSSGASAACVWIPALACLALSAVGAARVHLWRDEFATVAFTSLSFSDLGRATSHVDAVLAPYYALVHLVHSAGLSGAGLRVPSVLAAAATVFLTALLARRWWGNAAALVAGLALALNPLFAQLALDARPYALATFCTVLSTWLLERALDRSSAGRWVGYWAALTAAGLLHPFAVLVAGAHVALVLGRRRHGRPFALSVVAALLVLAPMALVAHSQSDQVSWISKPSPFRAVATLGNVVDYQTSGNVTGTALLFGAVVLAAAVLAALPPIRALRTEAAERARTDLARVGFAFALVVVPWLLLLIASWTVVPVLTTHYLAPSTVGVALLLGAGTRALGEYLHARFQGLAATTVAATVVLVVSVALVGPTTRAVTLRTTFQDDFAGLATALTQRAHPGDALGVVQMFSQTGLAVGVAHYSHDDAYLQTLLDRLPTGSQPIVDARVITGVRPWQTAPLRAGAATPGRMWLIYTGSPAKPEVSSALSALGCSADPSGTTTYGELVLSQISCDGAR